MTMRRKGVVLLICILVLGLLSVLAISFATLMRLEVSASQNYFDAIHAEDGTRIGLDLALAHIRADARGFDWFQGRASPWHRLNGSISPYGIGGKATDPTAFEVDITNEDGDNDPSTGRAAFWRYIPLSNLHAYGLPAIGQDTRASDLTGAALSALALPKKVSDLTAADQQYVRFAVQVRDLDGRLYVNPCAGGPSLAERRNMLRALLAAVNAYKASVVVDPGTSANLLAPDTTSVFATPGQIRSTLESNSQLSGATRADRDKSWARLSPFLTPWAYVDAGSTRAPINVNTAPLEVLLAVFNMISIPSLADASPMPDLGLPNPGNRLTLATCQGQLIGQILKKRYAAARVSEGAAGTADAYFKIHTPRTVTVPAPANTPAPPQTSGASSGETNLFATYAFQDMDDWEKLIGDMAPVNGQDGRTSGAMTGQLSERAANDILNNVVFFYDREQAAGDKESLYLPPPNGDVANTSADAGSAFAHDRELIKAKPDLADPLTWQKEPSDFLYKYDFDGTDSAGAASAWTSEPDGDLKEYGKRTTGDVDGSWASQSDPDAARTVEAGTRSRIFEIIVESEVVFLKYEGINLLRTEILASRRLHAVFDRGNSRFLYFRWVPSQSSDRLGPFGGTANANFDNYIKFGFAP